MALSDRNARRSDDAERARHIASTESVAFATMLLGLLNDADTVLHRLASDVQPVLDRTVPPPHPATIAPEPVSTDHGPVHHEQHSGATETPAVDSSPTIHAEATSAIQPQATNAALDAAPSTEAPTHALAPSPAQSNFDLSADHGSSHSAGSGHGGAITSSAFDLGATIHNLVDGVSGILDTSLAAVSNTITSLSTTVGQLTSTLTGTVSHLVDGLTGTMSGLLHDAPSTGLLEPLAELTGLTSSAGTTEFSDAAPHDGSLFDTAGAIPTSLLHPIPLQLGFLGQPTIDGHEPHDGAFSTLGGHHF